MPPAARDCEFCGKPFTPRLQNTARFCSKRCSASTPERLRQHVESQRRRHFRTKYGLTVEQVEALRSDATCAICGTTSEWGGPYGKPHIDHDHASGHVRGVLCNSCNTGLGLFRDDPDRLAVAIRYLAEAAAMSPPSGDTWEWRSGRVRTFKLTEEQANAMRADRASGATVPVLAEKYGIHRTTVYRMLGRGRPSAIGLLDTPE